MGTSTEELNTDIARTRESLSRDVDALQDKVSPSAIMDRRKSAARSRLASVKDRVMGAGQSVTGSAGSSAHGVTDSVSDAASGATGAVQDRVEGSPLAAGLVAFGAGLIVAALVPATEAEAQGAQKLQEVAQPVVDEARSAAQDVGEQLKDKATEAASEVKSSVQESASRVQDEAPISGSAGGAGTAGG